MDRVQALRDLGVNISPEQEWRGEPGTPERRPYDLPDTVDSIILPLTNDEWCSLAVRGGDYYVGGCCGTMSALQDEINGVFRDGGRIENGDFLRICELAEGHDGFEDFKPMDDATFSEYLKHWLQIGPWQKIGLIYNGVRPMLKARSFDKARVEHKHANELSGEQMINHLSNTLRVVAWGDLFTRDDPQHREQYELSRRVKIARIVEPIRRLQEVIENLDETVDVFAIVEPGTENVWHNSLGLCLYVKREDAEHIVKISTISKYEENGPVEAEIVEAQVNLKRGIIFNGASAA